MSKPNFDHFLKKRTKIPKKNYTLRLDQNIKDQFGLVCENTKRSQTSVLEALMLSYIESEGKTVSVFSDTTNEVVDVPMDSTKKPSDTSEH